MLKVIPAILLCIAAHAQGTSFRVDFPSEKSVLTVPGFVRIEWQEPSKDLQEHRLRFFAPSEVPVSEYTFARHVRIIGNKNAGWITITDFTGSSESRVVAFRLDRPKQRLDLLRELMKDPKVASLVAGNGHTYIEAMSLAGNGVVTLKVSGYGDRNPKGFSLHKKLALNEL